MDVPIKKKKGIIPRAKLEAPMLLRNSWRKVLSTTTGKPSPHRNSTAEMPNTLRR